jgi:hypothetical protein
VRLDPEGDHDDFSNAVHLGDRRTAPTALRPSIAEA